VTDTKNNENRRVPINETAREILRRRLKDNASDYVFYQSRSGKDGNEKPAKLKVLTNAFWEAERKAGLERKEIIKDEEKKIRFRFHDCRHTFGSRLGMAGVDLKTIMEIMGHRSAKVAMRYQHPTPEHKMNAVKILENYGLKHGQGKILELKK
jgi:integrase